MAKTSRIPGFYKISVEERQALVSESTGVSAREMAFALDEGGIDASIADKFVENVLGTYALPYGVALNVRVNQKDYVVPMVVEEPSVVAAASSAAKMVRAGGGFRCEADPPHMISQVQLIHVQDTEEACRKIENAKQELCELANTFVPGLVARGGGARDVEVRSLGHRDEKMIVAHVIVDCRDAMGANLVNSVAEGIAPKLAELARAKIGLRILSNLCDTRTVRVVAKIPVKCLATEGLSGDEVAIGILNASRFAELDPYRAATHNKGIMNGIDAVVIATGNDWRAVEAGAHAYAARRGSYEPLAVWMREVSDEGDWIVGRMTIPMALGIVGGTLRVHPAARLSLQLLNIESAQELAMVSASVGMASNLAAIRALASDGIQKGHMALHARAVAVAAGAEGDLVEKVAQMMVEAREITLDGAKRALLAVSDLPTPGSQASLASLQKGLR